MSTYADILQAEDDMQAARKAYLRRHGWKETCNTPGSYWLWSRDFVAEDLRRQEWFAETCKRIAESGKIGIPSPPKAMGVITAPLELAVTMTRKMLDEDDESHEDDAA